MSFSNTRKTDTKRSETMRRCLFTFFGIVLVATTLLTTFSAQKAYAVLPAGCPGTSRTGPLAPGTVCPTVAERAAAYCTSQKYSKTAKIGLSAYAACELGYASSLNGEQVDWDVICKADNVPTSAYDACVAGFKQGFREFIADNPSTISQSDAITRSAAYCESQNYSKTAKGGISQFQACERGYRSAIQGQQVDWNKICNASDIPSGAKDACVAGFKQGLREFQKDHGIANPSTPGGAGVSGGTGGTESASCEGTGGVDLSWLLCPIINGLAEASDGIYTNLVQPLLQTKPLDLSGSSKDVSHTYEIWSNFRIYGDIFLVIALLVIVFSEAIGGGLVDAYAAKKILPRLLIAAVLINLSIYVVALAVDITNIVGDSLGSLIQQPFRDAGEFKLRISGSAGTLGIVAIIGGLWAAAAATFAPLIMFLLVFILIPAFLALISIMVTVLVRQGLILFLVFVSPIAFALYCLPNTEKYFRKWWDLLLKTLLVYPIIAAIFAIANVLSVTIISTSSTSSGAQKTFASLLGLIALLAPLFLIPYSFKLAGGVLSQLHGLATNARKQGHGFIKGNANDQNSLQNKVRRNLSAKAANANISGGGMAAQFRPKDFTRGGRERRNARLTTARDAYQGFYGKQGMQAHTYDQYKDDSNVMEDLFRYGSGAESRKAIEKDFADGKIDAGGRKQRLFSSAAADRIGRSTFMRRQAFANPATIGYGVAEGEEGWNEAMGVARELAGGEKYDPAVGHDPRAPRFDPQSPSYDTKAAGDEGIYRGLQNQYQYVAKAVAGRADQSGAVDGGQYDFKRAWGSVGLYQHGNGKPTAIKAAGRDYFAQYQAATSGPVTPQAQENIADSARFYLEQETLAQSASGAARDAAVANMKAFEGAGIKDVLATEVPHGGYGDHGVNRRTGEPISGARTFGDLAKVGRRGYDREEAIRQSAGGA